MRLFRRHAPEEAEEPEPDPAATAEAQMSRLMASESHAAVFDGDLRVSGRFASAGSMVVRGSLHVEEDGLFDVAARVLGSVTLERGARTTHPLVVEGDLVLHAGARVPACHVEGTVTMHAGAAVEGGLRCRSLVLVEGPAGRAEAAAPVTEAAAEPAPFP